MNRDQLINRLSLENEQKWKDEIRHIPFLSFPAGWLVRVIPPFDDAVVRFQVKLPSGTRKSVYLDVRSSLGYFGGSPLEPNPYWEVHPYKGDVGRCDRCDTDTLMAMIADESEAT